jgi:hypothetical protein
MGRLAAIYLLVMIAVLIVVDVLFFRGQFGERLIANVGIVAVFLAVYFRFLK